MDYRHKDMAIIHNAMVTININNLTLNGHLDLKKLNAKTHLTKLKLKTTIWKNTTKKSHSLF